MTTITSSEGRTYPAALPRRVEAGETITITQRGVPVAELVPAVDKSPRTREELAKALKNFPKVPLNGITIRELTEEGRRY